MIFRPLFSLSLSLSRHLIMDLTILPTGGIWVNRGQEVTDTVPRDRPQPSAQRRQPFTTDLADINIFMHMHIRIYAHWLPTASGAPGN